MVLEAIQTEAQEIPEIIKSDYWELPICNLGEGKYAWRPRSAYLCYKLFDGPPVTGRMHGINLNRDLLIGAHGPRGATKTLTIAYLLAKKLRMGQPVWNNFPISFYVVEPTCWDVCETHRCGSCRVGDLSYYESRPLDFDKLYTFNSELSNGAVGLTELQYYAESRTSLRLQNRFLSYQIMQIRKSALSFFYDVQDEAWADKRFSWSDDIKIYCSDVSKMNYMANSVDHELDEGEIGQWRIRDISGICTGVQYTKSRIEYGPYQFMGSKFWWIYPTKWKIDVYDAVNSMKQDQHKADATARLGQAVTKAINFFLDSEKAEVYSKDFWVKASELGGFSVPPTEGGKVMVAYGIERVQHGQNKWYYDLSSVLEKAGDNGAKGKENR